MIVLALRVDIILILALLTKFYALGQVCRLWLQGMAPMILDLQGGV